MNKKLFIDLINSCKNAYKCPNSTSQVHSKTLKIGISHHSFFATSLISLYAEHNLSYAHKLFDETPHQAPRLYNVLLRGYFKDNQCQNTLHLFRTMLFHQTPDNFTLPIALKSCIETRDFQCAKMIHGFVKKTPKIDSDMFVGTALIEMYSGFGKMTKASNVFDEFDEPDIVMWTSLVTGFERNNNPINALAFFKSRVPTMGMDDFDPVTLITIVSACTQLSNMRLGACVHGFVIRLKFDSNLAFLNSLLNMYSKTGHVESASNIFKTMSERDVISWSSMISCHAQNGEANKALLLFNEMIDKGIEPNSVTLLSALQACAIARNITEGKKIHLIASRKGIESNSSISTSLVDMYMKCSAFEEAHALFERMPKKDVVAWVALLSGYAINGMAYESIGIFRIMLCNDILLDSVAIVKILAACSETGALQQATCLHGYVLKSGFDRNVFVGASLVELYSKCGGLCDAIVVFNGMKDRDLVVWSSMISGYGMHGRGIEALWTFDDMISNFSIRPNGVIFLSILSACSHSGLIREGIDIFNTMVRDYRLNPSSEHYGIIVDLLGRSGELNKAMDVINKMNVPIDPHIWGALLGACRIHHNVEIANIAAENLFKTDPEHRGYYHLLCNIYAVDGKWDAMEKLRNLMKKNSAKKVISLSTVEVSGEIHSFSAGTKCHPKSGKIYGLLKALELNLMMHNYFS